MFKYSKFAYPFFVTAETSVRVATNRCATDKSVPIFIISIMIDLIDLRTTWDHLMTYYGF